MGDLDPKIELRKMIGAMLLDEDADSLVVSPATGEAPIYLMPVEDKMSGVFDRLQQSDGTGNFVCRWDGGLAVLKLMPRAIPRDDPWPQPPMT
jgi:hypothetical protein